MPNPEQKLQEIIAQLNQKSADLDSISRDLDKKNHELTTINDSIIIHEERLRKTNFDVVEAESNLIAKQSTLSTLDEQIKQKNIDLQSIIAELDERRRAFDREQAEFQNLFIKDKAEKNKVLLAIEVDISQKNTEYTNLCSLVQSMSNSKEKYNEDIKNLSSLLLEKTQEYNDLQTAIESIKKILDQSHIELKSVNRELEFNRNESEIIKQNINKLQSSLNQLEIIRAGKQTEIDAMVKQKINFVEMKDILAAKEAFLKVQFQKIGIPYQ